jgi:hypothetical protein
MKRPKTKARPAKPLARPDFAPWWSTADAERIACSRWTSDSGWIVGCRVAVAVLAKTPDDLMRGALLPASADGIGPAETVCKALRVAEEELEAQLKAVRSAQARVLYCAAFVHGVAIPK